VDDAFWDQPDNATQAAADCQQQWGVTPRRHWPGLQCALQAPHAFAAFLVCLCIILSVVLLWPHLCSLPHVLLLLVVTTCSWPAPCRCSSGLPISRRDASFLLLHRFLGKDIDTASNIVFANGDLDPWSGGGVLEVWLLPVNTPGHTRLASNRHRTGKQQTQARPIEAPWGTRAHA
jgi:hypothetical protein